MPAGTAARADLARLGHRNLIKFWRESTHWGQTGEFCETDRMLLFATGSSALPGYNGAFRLVPDVAARDLLDASDDFFLSLGRGYSIKVRDTGEDDDLRAGCRQRRMVSFGAGSAAMALSGRPPAHVLPPGVDIREVTTEADVAAFIGVNQLAYSSYGTPPEEVEAMFSRPAGLLASRAVVSVVARSDGLPIAAAQTFLSDGIGGIYWVGTVPEMRGRGIGDWVSRAATNTVFDRGGDASILQASPMAEPIYRVMGYETLYRYQTYVRVPPANESS